MADTDGLTIEERVQVLEALVDTLTWGLHLADQPMRTRMAEQLQMKVERAAQSQALPDAVLQHLSRFANGLAGR